MPDRGGQGEQAGVNARQGAAAVVFEGELALEGADDGLGPLALPGEPAKPRGLVLAAGADQARAELAGDEGLGVPPGEALAAEDDLPGATLQTGTLDPVFVVAFSPDGKLLASGGYDGTARRAFSVTFSINLRSLRRSGLRPYRRAESAWWPGLDDSRAPYVAVFPARGRMVRLGGGRRAAGR
jgi:hypothetical protein